MSFHRATSPFCLILLAATLTTAACQRSTAPSTDVSDNQAARRGPAGTLAQDNPVPKGAKTFLDVDFDRIDALRVSPDRRRIAVIARDVAEQLASKSVGFDDSTILSPRTVSVTRVFDRQTQRQLAELEQVERAVWSRDSTSLAAVAHRAKKRHVSTESQGQDLGDPGSGLSKKVHTGLAPDADTYDVRLFDTSDGDWRWVVGTSPDPVLAVGFARDDRQVLAVYHVGPRSREPGEEAEVKVGATTSELLYTKPCIEFRFYRSSNGELIETIKGPETTHPAAVVGPDGTSVALWELDAKPASVSIIDPKSGTKRFELADHRFGIGHEGVTFSPGGRYIATAALGDARTPVDQRTAENDAAVCLWGAKTGERLDTILGQSGAVGFSRDETRLVTHRAHREGNDPKDAFSVWNVRPRSLLRRVAVPDELTLAIFFTENGVLTVGMTHHEGLKYRILIWDLPPEG